MFSNNNELKGAESIVGPSVKIKGDFSGDGDIIVEGEVDGSIKAGGALFIKEKAKVVAGVMAKSAAIKGHLKGDIVVSESLEIGSLAKIEGDVSCSAISVEKGAIINGCITMSVKAEGAKTPRSEKTTNQNDQKEAD